MADSENPLISPLLSYCAISSALFIPVLIWPLQGVAGGSAEFHSAWLIMASALLLCAVTADSILYHQPDSLWPYFATAWILVASIVVSLALRTQLGPHIMASIFALHASRSGIRLWQDEKGWWLWPAWVRDSATALVIFSWITLLSQGGS